MHGRAPYMLTKKISLLERLFLFHAVQVVGNICVVMWSSRQHRLWVAASSSPFSFGVLSSSSSSSSAYHHSAFVPSRLRDVVASFGSHHYIGNANNHDRLQRDGFYRRRLGGQKRPFFTRVNERPPRGGCGGEGGGGSREDFVSNDGANSFSCTTSSSLKTAPDKHRFITYITDIEGDREYLTRYVNLSRVLYMQPRQSIHNTKTSGEDTATNNTTPPDFPFPYDHYIDFYRPHHDILVFGGDIWDQGGSDLYVIRQLLYLKQRYPDSVYFVWGNRDINKMRIYAELGTNDDTMPKPHPGVHWLRNTQRLGDPNHKDHNTELNDPVRRLKWMLQETMGSPRAFAYRKRELEQLQKEYQENDDANKSVAVTDMDVVESYRSSCHPNGEMGRFLAAGQLAVQLGDALFVHGSLPMTDAQVGLASSSSNSNNSSNSEHQTIDRPISQLWEGNLSFAMPWLEPNTTMATITGSTSDVARKNAGVRSVADWLQALNQFGNDQITEWRNHPATGVWSLIGGYHNIPYEDMRPGCQLLQYGMGWCPDRSRNPTVVYASWNTDGMPHRFFPIQSSLSSLSSSNDTTADFQTTSSGSSRGESYPPFFQATQSFFQSSGIRILCSGHQPQGDMPNVIRVPLNQPQKQQVEGTLIAENTTNRDDCAWIFACDTSYSGDVYWFSNHDNPNHNNSSNHNNGTLDSWYSQPLGRQDSLSGRGRVAVSEVLLMQNITTGTITRVICQGILSNGRVYETVPYYNHQNDACHPPSQLPMVVGCLAQGSPLIPPPMQSPHKGPWWTRACFTDGSVLLVAGKGFDVWNLLLVNASPQN